MTQSPTQLTREEILAALQSALEPLEYVYAMWQGGSAAFNRADQWSDIDLQVDVADEHAGEIMPLVEKTLSALSPIDLKFEVPQPAWHGHLQTLFRLSRASKYLLIDFVVIRHSNANKFLQPEQHGEAVVLFDKAGVVQAPQFDWPELQAKLRGRLEHLRTTFDLFQILTLKELNRGNAVDALVYYIGYTLRPLVEALRIRYKPERYDFSARYLYVDLPIELARQVERLYFVADAEDLRQKRAEAEKWFYQILDEIRLD